MASYQFLLFHKTSAVCVADASTWAFYIIGRRPGCLGCENASAALFCRMFIWHFRKNVSTGVTKIWVTLLNEKSIKEFCQRIATGSKNYGINWYQLLWASKCQTIRPLWIISGLHFKVLLRLILQLRPRLAMRGFSSLHRFNDLRPQFTEAFLVKWDAGQRPMKKGMSANHSFFPSPLMWSLLNFSSYSCTRGQHGSFSACQMVEITPVVAWRWDYTTKFE